MSHVRALLNPAMTVAGQTEGVDKPSRFSFWFIGGVLAVAALLHLGGPLVVILFSFFALTKLNFLPKRGRWVAVGLFIFVGATLVYGLGLFINQMVRALPDIADSAIPVVIEWAKRYQMEVPFTDFDSLKETARDAIKSQMHYLSSFAQVARGAASEVILCVVGVVIAIAMFLNRGFEPGGKIPVSSDNVYAAYTAAIATRFKTFYESFATVMGAQLVISAINTVLTAIFVFSMQMPHALLVTGATFICGLLPIVGNLLSNTIIVGVGITVSPKVAIICLVFLIVVHKLEYFLNGKIVGSRIRNPFWLTLLGLIIGEKLMGIPGMILAPVVLNYIKVEASRIRSGGKPVASAIEKVGQR
jgi:predicted PurR-regulated permease PerM